MERRQFIFCLCLILCEPWPACAEDPPVLRLGVIESLTGVAAENGKTVVNGVKLATSEFNRKRHAGVELIIEDDQSLPTKSVTAFQTLLAQGVDAIIGGTWDIHTNVLVSQAARERIPLLSTSNFVESLNLSEGKGFVFTNGASIKPHAARLAEYLRDRKISTVSILYANNSWGEIHARSFSQVADQSGANVLSLIQVSDVEHSEVGSVLLHLRQREPQLLVLALNKDDIDLALRRLDELHWTPAVFAANTAVDAFHLTSTPDRYEGLCFTRPSFSTPAQIDFATLYEKQYGEAPLIFADSSYDAVGLLLNAWGAARRNQRAFVENLREQPFDGVVGHYRYNNNSSLVAADAELVCIHNHHLQRER